jgi:transcription termination factor Rho
LATNDDTTTTDNLPFGAMDRTPVSAPKTRKKKATTSRKKAQEPEAESSGSKGSERKVEAKTDSRPEKSGGEQGEGRRQSRRGGRRGRRPRTEEGDQKDSGGAGRQERQESTSDRSQGDRSQGDRSQGDRSEGDRSEGGKRRRRRGRPRNKRRRQQDDSEGPDNSQAEQPRSEEATSDRQGSGGKREKTEAQVGSGMFIEEKGGFGTLRDIDRQYLPSKLDIFVPKHLISRHKLKEGSVIEGPLGRGNKNKYQLEAVTKVDGKDPGEWGQLRAFKSLTSIDPDFHYAVGDVTGDVSMRILDLIAPIGRGQRGLIVAQPRTGKTTLMRQFAAGIEKGYPEVHLMVLLVDERPEEATDWIRSTGAKVFVSTSDETPKNHVRLAEAVWKRCQRLVEMGEDVVLILDSITRLARAYNNVGGGSGRTMSGGLDSRAMERPRQIFGSARNTETAGSLTILGTALIDTGSRMDQLIFEEFKGTGNMEVMLNRKLADRRIFPAIDIEKSGTRKEEKLISSRRLKRINTLRRVLLRMNFIEAMELLSEKLLDVEKTEDFLKRFDVDPEA